MSVRRAIRTIYRELDDDGFEISKSEVAAVRASRGDPTYGELTPAGVDRLLRELEPTPDDVFYDLGSGIGKVVLQVAMSVPIARCVGVELSASRCRLARTALRRARRRGLILARRTVIRHGDLLAEPIDDATMVYTCSTAYSLRFMAMIARKLRSVPRSLRFVTLQELITVPRGFRHVRTVTVATTWNRRTPAHVYRVNG